MILSVLIICYNQKDFIASAINSVLEQKTSFDFEIIVGDDSSTDGTSEIIKSFVKSNANIKHFRHDSNLGLMKNYSYCHSIANGKYIASLDGDDYWIDSYKLEKQVNILESDENIGLVHTQYDINYMYPKFLGKRYVTKVLSKTSLVENSTFNGIYSNSSICSSTVCYRKSIIDKSQLMDKFDNAFFKMEDGPIHLQCALNHSVKHINHSTTVYRVHKQSVSHFTNGSKRLQFIQETRQIRDYFSTIKKIDDKTQYALDHNNNLSLAHHYYKSNNLPEFKRTYKKINHKPLAIRVMHALLWLKNKKLLRNENIFKH
ncbi:glycosyltransferase family 2 protein [Carboxylicivirga sp. M1479]|uniref:glycosyltransferase family 2 protein n=1 Tax=Carboxylicivirga sp. M1479 TaxID=2594476 RepID=UPI001178160E|nr:glycosyltransferase family 2 protein [Carboxylicivirga sp. M1479]TRX72631.1 glycosyltransferase family 2 protein [Carboxylicivirga sp. M1479]